MVILINGASGAGKTFLLERLTALKGHNYVPLKKYTTRSKRTFELSEISADLIYNCAEAEVRAHVYHYSYKKEWYGVDQAEILNEVNKGHVPVIIVRSFDVIRKIKQDFNKVKVLFVVGGFGDSLKERLRLQGRASKDINISEAGVESITREYLENIDVVDNCILNYLYDEELYIKQFFEYAV